MVLLLACLAFAEELPDLETLLPEVPSFQTANKRLYTKVHHDRQVTFYCTCPFDENRDIDLSRCLMSEVTAARASRVEAEHVVPASVIGRDRPCWAEGGRAHCLKVDRVFYIAHSDLHNLRPAVGHINGQRSNLSFGYVFEEPRLYGACDFEIDQESDLAEPAPAVRGDIARTYFYMEYQYGIRISEGQRRLFLYWASQDPVDSWERERDRRIEELQGNSNPFVR